VRHNGIIRFLSIVLLTSSVAASIGIPFVAHAEEYQMIAFPSYSQEGSTTITILLGVGNAQPSTTYEFRFFVRDPSTAIWSSSSQKHTTGPLDRSFTIFITFPSTEFSGGSTSYVGYYNVWVNQVQPIPPSNPVSVTGFIVGIIDRYNVFTGQSFYQRTQNVSIVATGYVPFETVSVEIRRTDLGQTVVYSHNATADSAGRVTDAWSIPKNAVLIDDYIARLSGTITSKSVQDIQGFNVQAAQMTVASFSSSKSSYQRTETMSFSFQPAYPSGQLANTGLAVITLTRPDLNSITLSALYNSTTQSFVAKYQTTATDQTGTWTAYLDPYAFDDGFGNLGPSSTLTSAPILTIATLGMTISMKSSFGATEQIKFNATVTYPDGAIFSPPSTVSARLALGGGTFTTSVFVVFDSGLNLWIGTYSPTGSEPTGPGSLTINATDLATPANYGISARALSIDNRNPVALISPSTTTSLTGVAISFDGTGSFDIGGTILTYYWDFGDGTTGSGATVGHAYTSPGTYTVTLTVSDNGGATNSAPQTVIITAAASPSGDPSIPLYYFGLLAALIASMLGGGLFFLRRHKVTHARLKIDLEAVRTEAGRIENQEFFQSVKDQLKKDKDD